MVTVYQVGDNWEYIESLEEKDSKDVSRSMFSVRRLLSQLQTE